jgi:signal transduction histidine kinase
MQERALHVGGRLTSSTPPAGGTEVRLDVPLPEGPA